MTKRNVMRLIIETDFETAQSWIVQARFALRQGGSAVSMPPDTVVLEMLPTQYGQKTVYRYRLPDGCVLTRTTPLTNNQATIVTDPALIDSMNAYHTLEEAAKEELGVDLGRISRHLPIFNLIRCPICGGTEFGSAEMTGVWCPKCGTCFEARDTAGDPGFVVDATFEDVETSRAIYLLPPGRGLIATLVLKDSDDPREMDTRDCHCDSNNLKLTDGTTGLRVGLHVCKVGTLYDWDKFYGTVPALDELSSHLMGRAWNVDGQNWPACAMQNAIRLLDDEKMALKSALSLLEKEGSEYPKSVLESLLKRHKWTMRVHDAHFPPISELQPGERYLLHHWLSLNKDDCFLPVWYVVRPEVESQLSQRWNGLNVVRKDICPVCGKRVTPDQLDAGQYSDKFEDPHGWCREKWNQIQWQPSLAPTASRKRK